MPEVIAATHIPVIEIHCIAVPWTRECDHPGDAGLLRSAHRIQFHQRKFKKHINVFFFFLDILKRKEICKEIQNEI